MPNFKPGRFVGIMTAIGMLMMLALLAAVARFVLSFPETPWFLVLTPIIMGLGIVLMGGMFIYHSFAIDRMNNLGNTGSQVDRDPSDHHSNVSRSPTPVMGSSNPAYCSHCGSKIDQGDNFCSSCGMATRI